MSNKVDISDIPNVAYNPHLKAHRCALATALTLTLERAKFQFSPKESDKEEVWIRTLNNDPNVRIKVYTSIINKRERKENGEISICRTIRSKGKDAIRVCATVINNDQESGLVKSNRINRIGTLNSISSRTLIKMREVYKTALQRRNWKNYGKNRASRP